MAKIKVKLAFANRASHGGFLLFRFGFVAFILFALQLGLAHSETSTSFHSLKANSIDGQSVDLSEYKGKTVLVVNVASKCGYTPQYKGLEELYRKNKDKGFVVLGFPSNDFGSQEPGSGEDIKKFCKTNYDVSFPLFEKSSVKGSEKQPIFEFLTENSPADMRGEVAWNFEKFLVAPDGRVVGRWKSNTEPTDSVITSAIEKQISKAKR